MTDDLDLPEDEGDDLREVAVGWSGPLPHPAALREFEDLVPGAADRIIGVFEVQVHSRLATERYDSGTARLGMMLAFILSLVLIGAGLVAMWLGYGWGAVTLTALAIAAVINSFARFSNRDESQRQDSH